MISFILSSRTVTINLAVALLQKHTNFLSYNNILDLLLGLDDVKSLN